MDRLGCLEVGAGDDGDGFVREDKELMNDNEQENQNQQSKHGFHRCLAAHIWTVHALESTSGVQNQIFLAVAISHGEGPHMVNDVPVKSAKTVFTNWMETV